MKGFGKMERDIKKYTKDYINFEFEETMVLMRRKLVLQVLEKYLHRNILDIGCGSNPIFTAISNLEKITIVEPSEVFFGIAKEKVKECNIANKISIYNDLVENCAKELVKESFDFIICSGLIHEVDDPNALLSNISKICNQETVVHINAPNSSSFHLLWAYEAGLIDHIGELTESSKKMQHHSTFNIASLKEICESNGFEIIESGSYFIKPFSHKQMQKLIDAKIISLEVLDALNSMIKYMPDMGSEIYINMRLKRYE